jgi:hypothetical protein
MADHADEIAAVIADLQARGEYEQFAAKAADREGDRIGDLIAWAGELDDDDVAVLASVAPEAPAVPLSQLEDEVAGVIERHRMREEVTSELEHLRTSRGLGIGAVVSVLMQGLRLDPAKRQKVRSYYEALETGLLDWTAVSRRVWEALADGLGASVDDLLAMPPPAEARLGVFPRRLSTPARSRLTFAEWGWSSEWDEVDELFRGRA